MSKMALAHASPSNPLDLGKEGEWTPSIGEIRGLIDHHIGWHFEVLWSSGKSAEAGCVLGGWLDMVPDDPGRWKSYIAAIVEAHDLFHAEVCHAKQATVDGGNAELVKMILPSSAVGNASNQLVMALNMFVEALECS